MDVENVRVVFDTFDLDKSGGISLDELQSAIKVLGIPNCSKQRVAEMFHEADIDRSGEIDFDEFVDAVKLQVAEGRAGGLADLVREATGILGFFNDVLSFFNVGGKATGAPPAADADAMGGDAAMSSPPLALLPPSSLPRPTKKQRRCWSASVPVGGSDGLLVQRLL